MPCGEITRAMLSVEMRDCEAHNAPILILCRCHRPVSTRNSIAELKQYDDNRIRRCGRSSMLAKSGSEASPNLEGMSTN